MTIDEENRIARQLMAKNGNGNGGGGVGGPTQQINIKATGEASDHIISGDSVDVDELHTAELRIIECGFEGVVSATVIAKILKGSQLSSPMSKPREATKDDQTYEQKKENLSKEVYRLQQQAAFANLKSRAKKDGVEYTYDRNEYQRGMQENQARRSVRASRWSTEKPTSSLLARTITSKV